MFMAFSINIPLRSVFMLEFAVERARVLGGSEISIFVGEIHNSDMAWLAGFDEALLDQSVLRAVNNVRSRAIELARARGRPSRLRFALAALAGASPLSIYFGLGMWLWANR